jgi:proteasome lid subunit RPN8/RPN11
MTGTSGEVKIRRAAVDAMIAHARLDAPNECCGLLVGAGTLIDEAVRVRNIEAGPARYTLDPAEHIAVNARLRGSGRAVLGAYHSHPRTSATPSPSDLAEAFYPDFVYVIVSLARPDRPECRGWRIRAGAAVEVGLAVAEE